MSVIVDMCISMQRISSRGYDLVNSLETTSKSKKYKIMVGLNDFSCLELGAAGSLQSYVCCRVWRKQFLLSLGKENICRAMRGGQKQNRSFDSRPCAALFVASFRLRLIWQPKKPGFASRIWHLKGWGYLYRQQAVWCTMALQVKNTESPPVSEMVTKIIPFCAWNITAFMKIEVFISFSQL